MLLRALLSLLLALAAVPVASQNRETATDAWARGGDRITNVRADISFPARAGVVELRQADEFSREGEGLDTNLQYTSDDREVFATVYVYYPGLPHAGVAAYMTDHVIATNAPAGFRPLGTRIVAAGGHEGTAIRIEYSRAREGMASSAAFLKAGRWIVKLRVTGPEGRRDEIAQAMTELLAEVRFEGEAQPRAAAALTTSTCPPGSDPPDARERPDPDSESTAADALIATFDGGGAGVVRAEDGTTTSLPSRIPTEFCVSAPVEVGPDATVPLLRAADGPPLSVDGRTVVLVPITDSGTTLEVVHAQNLNGYVLLHHRIGVTSVLGTYDAIPSDRQIGALFSDPRNPAARVRAVVELRPGQGDHIRIIGPAPAAGAEPTT